MNRGFCVVALVFVVAACGSDDDGGNAPDAAPTADADVDAPPRSTVLDPVCNATDGLFVDLFSRFFECNPIFEILVGVVEAEQLSELCYASFQPFIDDGTITVTGNTAACRAYVSTECQLFDIDVADCDDVFVGTVAAGNDCEISEQCTPGNYCNEPASGCGSCEATLGDGSACEGNDACTSGYCTAAGTCAPKGNVGDACGDDQDCLGQIVCDEGNTDQCVAPVPVSAGDPCDSTNFVDCGFPLSGFFCAETTQECTAEVDVGMACDSVDSRCHTIAFEWCDNGTCAAPATAAEGQACTIGFNTQASKCQDGLVCTDAFNGGTCVEQQKEGEACVDSEGVDLDNECEFLLTCESGTCTNTEYTGMCPAP